MLEEYRVMARLSQVELADLVGVNQSTIARYESKVRKPRIKTAIKIIEVLRSRKVKATIQELFG